MASVFVSYARQDLSYAKHIAEALEKAGHSVWWDRHIKGGAQFAKEIELALEASQAIVVLWSQASVESAWVRDEAAVGRDSKRLIPVSVDGTLPPLGFRQFQTIQVLRKGDSAGPTYLDELLGAVSGDARPSSTKDRPDHRSGNNGLSRRAMLSLGIIILGAATGGYFALREGNGSVPAEVKALMVQGRLAQMQGNYEGQTQAIASFQRIVSVAPSFADGWAALALAYRDSAQSRPQHENEKLREQTRYAAQRALEIDPENGLAEAMIAASVPHRRGLFQMEHGLRRALRTDPKDEILALVLSSVLRQGGRANEAVEVLKTLRTRPLLPVQYYNIAHALWAANRTVELERLIGDAEKLYPAQPTVWFLRLELWGFSRSPERAEALLRDRAKRPAFLSDTEVQIYLKTMGAVKSQQSDDDEGVLSAWMERARQGTVFAEDAIQYASLLGRLDEAFELANAYYFGEGFRVPDVTAPGANDFLISDERETALLFEPPVRLMREDKRFSALAERLGLEDYWRQANVVPDFRKH